ncbi:MAG: MFS transporter [Bacteroidales bacterium]|nr:MFS transporter [Bacteroidales bacterium]
MQKNLRGLTFAILSISLLTVMAGAAMAPALGAIREHFADYSAMTVQLIVSLPALTIILTTFLFRPLCRLMRTRTLALTGLLLYVLAGAGAFMVDNMGWLLVLRALLGVSVGMVMPLSTGLLSFYFAPEEQSRLMGLSAAMNQMGGVVATLLAGVLATVEWRYAFLVYLAGLLALVLVSIFLPNESLRGNAPAGDDAQQRAAKPSTLKLLKRFHPSVTAMFLTMLLFFVYPTNFALTAHGQGIDTLTTTLIMVGLDVVAFVIGLCFGGLMRRLRRQMKYVAPLGFVGGYALLAFVPGMGGMIAGSALIGVANGVGVPYLNTIASIKGGRDAAVTVMPLISAALYLGQFVSPLVVSPLARLIGSASAPYIVAVGIGVLFLIQMYLTRRQQALPPAA